MIIAEDSLAARVYCRSIEFTYKHYGGDEATRTPYLSNANAALYQVSYVPAYCFGLHC